MSGVPFTFAGSNAARSYGGFFLKIPSAPSATYTLWDMDFGISGYLRLKMNTSRHIILEVGVNCTPATLDVTPSNPVPTGEWCWLTFDTNANDAGFNHRWIRYDAELFVAGGTSPDGVRSVQTDWNIVDSDLNWQSTMSGVMGWGVATSDSTAGNQNAAGWELSKLQLKDNHVSNTPTPVLLSPPSSDVSGGRALYLCRQSAGAVTGTLTDSSGNGYNLTPAGGGCTIASDGPYS